MLIRIWRLRLALLGLGLERLVRMMLRPWRLMMRLGLVLLRRGLIGLLGLLNLGRRLLDRLLRRIGLGLRLSLERLLSRLGLGRLLDRLRARGS